MEEMMMMMIKSPENPSKSEEEPITTSTCPSWKLYENPFYSSQQTSNKKKHVHRLHLPVSARKIAASFLDLRFFKPIMNSDLEIARGKIFELKAELEFERKARKKMESMNKKLVKEVAEERRGREALEKVCEQLAKEVSANKSAIDRMKREMEEERKMLRMAEVMREERVQMKLAEAKILFEEKLLEFEVSAYASASTAVTFSKRETETENPRGFITAAAGSTFSKQFSNDEAVLQRKASPETENPHIKRGIKGFVEFPKVVRAIGSRSKQLGNKLECQKAQLRMLLKQKRYIRGSNSLITS